MKFGLMVRAMDAQDNAPRAASLLGISRADAEHALIHGEFIPKAIARLPQRWAQPVIRTYKEMFRGKGRKAAAGAVLDVLESVSGFRMGAASSEDDLRAFAKARADECFRLAGYWKDEGAALEAMQNVALRYGIEPPEGRNVTADGARARFLDAIWWRRKARKVAGRQVEGAAVKVGLVHRRAGLYASNETVARRAGQKRRNREMLESIIAENDEKQQFTLAELSDLGVSNPKIRRMELMVRLAGFDQLAIQYGHAAEFYTLTAPSQFHARDSISGKTNKNYKGATPQETQRYLCKVWSRMRAALHRRGIRIYGFRVAEPHHDGTPHWHMVLFYDVHWRRVLCGPVQPGQEPYRIEDRCAAVPRVRAILRRYALALDGDEPGARVHRFKAEAIDRSKGSAVGYLAKYIAKNIDGHGVGEDWEAVEGQDDAKDSARRVDAWASCWGIRQFQQIGGAPVTVWRELRRLDAEQHKDFPLLEALIGAADAGGDPAPFSTLSGWAAYTNIMGGPFLRRAGAIVKPHYVTETDTETGEIQTNKYGEIAGASIKGLLCLESVIETRVREWVFLRGGAAATPWSSVNNCTRLSAEALQTASVLDRVFKQHPWKTDFMGVSDEGEFIRKGGSSDGQGSSGGRWAGRVDAGRAHAGAAAGSGGAG